MATTPAGVDAPRGTGPGWRPAQAAARDPELLDDLLRRIAAAAGTRSMAVAATWQLEKHAWYVAHAALGRMVAEGRLPDLDGARVHDAPEGWVDDVELPPGGRPADGPALAAALEAHLAPLVGALGRHRPRRALWRSVGDRLGQAAGWCGEAAIVLATAALEAPTALQAHGEFLVVDGEPFRWRTGCCLSLRCEDGVRCDDCTLTLRRGAT